MKKNTLTKVTSITKFEVGERLPEKLPKQTREFFENAVTPQKAYDVAAKVSRLIERSGQKSSFNRTGNKSVV